ncbi:protein of unknown function [Burkholderia multivorans]
MASLFDYWHRMRKWFLRTLSDTRNHLGIFWIANLRRKAGGHDHPRRLYLLLSQGHTSL